jgi:hypothetical protein
VEEQVGSVSDDVEGAFKFGGCFFKKLTKNSSLSLQMVLKVTTFKTVGEKI